MLEIGVVNLGMLYVFL